jgi:hypothetical protein
MKTISIGLFFSRVLLVVGFASLGLGTIGGIVLAFQRDCYEDGYSTYCSNENVIYGLTTVVVSLAMSSLLIVVASYIDVRLTRIVVDMATHALRQQDPSLTDLDARALVESDDELAVERFQDRGE